MIHPLYLAGNFVTTENFLSVVNPFDGDTIAQVSLADADIINQAIQSAAKAKNTFQSWSSLQISEALLQISKGIETHKSRFVQAIITESAKPKRYAIGEVERAIETFRIAAFEATRLPHELISLDDAASGKGLMGRVQYSSAGVIAGISPFNFPLNLVAHKVAPAIATKSPIILKPSSSTPLTALLLGEIIHQCHLPNGAFSVLPCSRTVGDFLIEDHRIQVLSFTGSPQVGWDMKNRAGKKRVVLELGGNAASIVCEDADLDSAVNQCFVGSFAYSGQVCIHTQRIYVHDKIYSQFCELFIDKARQLSNQNPNLDSCEMSVMIDEQNALRVEKWIQEAVNQGAKLLYGGKRENNFVQPTILENTNRNMKVHDEEVFGPVVCINRFHSVEEAIEKVNDSKFGLQSSIFTQNQSVIENCFAKIETGGLILNRATTFRTDQMPYGGIKDSGFGREGIKYAMMDYLEPKILVF